MYIQYGSEKAYAEKLKLGLSKLGPNFTAFICWWCDGTGHHNFEYCDVCGKTKYSQANGLLWPGLVPAPDSVAYQVLNAAED